MIRLLFKMFAYGLVGYCVYEFFRGASGSEMGEKAREWGREAGNRLPGGEEEAGARRQRTFRRQQDQIGHGDGGATMTGTGRGMKVETQDADGGTVPVRVGRGVKV